MGGNALKNTFTRRFERDEYHAVSSEALIRLLSSEDGIVTSANIIPAYREKESFGDVDILYSTKDGLRLSDSEINRLFRPKEVVKNHDVISLDFKEIQVDLIHTPAESMEYAMAYFAWNDQFAFLYLHPIALLFRLRSKSIFGFPLC